MRVWDIHPGYLSRQSLLGEHREIHAIWNIITQNKKGYSKHPETLRWQNRLYALWVRHNQVVNEMLLRGYNHNSILNMIGHFQGNFKDQNKFINTHREQRQILLKKYQGKNLGRLNLV